MVRSNLISIGCMLLVFVVYLLTLAPTVQGFDSAELTVGAYSLGFVHAPGYPLYMLLGHIFAHLPFGNVGKQLNLMSAIFASLSILVLLRIQLLDSGIMYALPSVFLFATAPLFWSQAIRAEVYTLHVFIVTCVFYIWRRAHYLDQPLWLVLCFAILGLGMGNHPTIFLLWGTLLGCLAWESKTFKKMGIVGTILGFAVTGTLYLYFPLRNLEKPAVDYISVYFQVDLSTLSGVWWLFSAQMFHHAFFIDRDLTKLIHEVLKFGRLLWDNFLGMGFVLGLWGWLRSKKREILWNRLLIFYFISNIIGFVCYHVVDKEVMFIPAFIPWSLWISNGIREFSDLLTSNMPRRSTEVGKFISIALLVIIALGAKFNWQVVSLNGNQKIYEFAGQILENAEPFSLIVNHWATASVLDYLRIVEGRRPDVESFNVDFYNLALQERYGSLEDSSAKAEWYNWLSQNLSQRPICFIEPLPAVPEHYYWIKQGPCWKLLLKSHYR